MLSSASSLGYAHGHCQASVAVLRPFGRCLSTLTCVQQQHASSPHQALVCTQEVPTPFKALVAPPAVTSRLHLPHRAGDHVIWTARLAQDRQRCGRQPSRADCRRVCLRAAALLQVHQRSLPELQRHSCNQNQGINGSQISDRVLGNRPVEVPVIIRSDVHSHLSAMQLWSGHNIRTSTLASCTVSVSGHCSYQSVS